VVLKISKSPDITETVIVDLTGRTSQYYDPDTYAFDVAVGGLPFLYNITDTIPYRRSTARWKYERVDQAREPGEQTLDSGLWVRSQTSWHLGAGIQFQEALEGNPDLLRFRYLTSTGIDPWTVGELSLLKDTSKVYNVTSTSATAKTIALPATIGGVDHMLVVNTEATAASTSAVRVSKVTADGTASTLVDGTVISKKILAAETDGSEIYLATEDYIYHGDFTGGSLSLHQHYHINTANATNIVLRFTKNRILAGVTYVAGTTPTAAVYELPFTTHGSAVNLSTITPITNTSTVPNGWIWSDIGEGRGAIYLSGYAGDKSAIFKIQPDATTGNLGPAISVADIPRGETVRTLFGYLGTYLAIGTSRGVRIAAIADDASIVYGPIIFETTDPVTCFAARDSYIWAGVKAGVGGASGTYRIYLGQLLDDGGYPYATDIFAAGSTGAVDSIGFFPSTGQLFFTVTASGVWLEHATQLVSEGNIQTAIVNWGTLEKKAWKRVRVETDTLQGKIEVYADSIEGRSQIVTLTEGSEYNTDFDLSAAYLTPQVNGQLTFSLYRKSDDATKGAVLKGYAIKAIPSPTRSRLIQMPLMCYDFETDRRGVRFGVEDGAKIRIAALEALESSGSTVLVQDFTSGENFDTVIEEIAFTRMTPPSQNNENFGGIITITMRTVV
jgi:hypothetical protein